MSHIIVDDTTWAIYNKYQARQIGLVTRNTTFSVGGFTSPLRLSVLNLKRLVNA